MCIVTWRRKWQPTPVFLPGESHGWRSLVGYSPRGRKGSDMTERLYLLTHLLELYLLHWHRTYMYAQLLSCVWLFVFPWTVAHHILCPNNFPDKNTGVGCCFLFQHIFPTQGLNLCVFTPMNWQVDSLPPCHMGGPLTWKLVTKYYLIKQVNYQTILLYVCIQTDQNKISHVQGEKQSL